MIDNGANVNAARTDNGGTALHSAIFQGHLEVVRLLIQKNANKSATTFDGITPLGMVRYAVGPHKAAIQALLKP